MKILYNAGIRVASSVFRVASLFNAKASQFVNGRKNILSRLAADLQNERSQRIWVHCASLGEFEQGRPVMEAIRREFPDIKIVLTFFSPSGFELRKNYAGADFIYYLPWDTSSSAAKFIQLVNPLMAIFVKYEFWYYYLKKIKYQQS